MIYDPTIFDNLKVAFENYIYDLDNETNEVTITNRKDLMDMATMSKEFSLEFMLVDQPDVLAEVILKASLEDLAAEIMEKTGENPGCTLYVRFYMEVEDVASECDEIEEIANGIWNQRPLTQTLTYVYGANPSVYMNTLEVGFNRKINEDQIQDIPALMDHVLETLAELN